jgi:hypothetical protein
MAKRTKAAQVLGTKRSVRAPANDKPCILDNRSEDRRMNHRTIKTAPIQRYDIVEIQMHLKCANRYPDQNNIHWLTDEFWHGYERIERAYTQWAQGRVAHTHQADLHMRLASAIALMAETCEELEDLATAELG